MNPHYSPEQEKLYFDYADVSDEELLQKLENKSKYRNQVIDIIADILIERDKLPKNYESAQEFEIEAEIKKTPDEMVAGAIKDVARDDFIRALGVSGLCFILACGIYLATHGKSYCIDWGCAVTGVFNLVIGLMKYLDK